AEEQPLKSSTTISASTAVAAAVAAPPIIRARLVELLLTGVALKDFRSAMFVSPPLPSGSTLLNGTEAAIHKSPDSTRVSGTANKASRAAENTVCAA
ncbi:MAG TPA: hypothetical protein VGK01_24560, partial [Candidatus Angelobacter sp.]